MSEPCANAVFSQHVFFENWYIYTKFPIALLELFRRYFCSINDDDDYYYYLHSRDKTVIYDNGHTYIAAPLTISAL